MQIFGIYNELSKQLILNPANNRDPKLFTSEEDAKEFMQTITTARNVAWLKVVELEVTIEPAKASKDEQRRTRLLDCHCGLMITTKPAEAGY